MVILYWDINVGFLMAFWANTTASLKSFRRFNRAGVGLGGIEGKGCCLAMQL
jgi:hypothetical protein